MKGIVLAGGAGTRLQPLTLGTSKQLLPVYDKPMIYYPISVLMLAGIRDILIISTPEDLNNFRRLLGSGEQFGVNFCYAEQPTPGGLAQAFIIGEDFIGKENVALILGDNIYWGQGFSEILKRAVKLTKGACLFGYKVIDPGRFGVISFNKDKTIEAIEEKPTSPKSNYAVTGLYFYDNNVVNIAKNVEPSSRGELEITCINKHYLENDDINVELLGRGFAWLDTGTFESLLEAAMFVETIEKRQGYKIACLEEIGYKNGWLEEEKLIKHAQKLGSSAYGIYLKELVNQ